MAQSSIEYLMEMIRLNGKDFYAMLLDDKVFEQAKEMHKEELKKCAETFEVCYYDGIHNGTTFNEYYNEEFGGNNGTK